MGQISMQTQGAMFGLAAGDIDFLRRVIHVRRQVKLAGTTLRFAPVKNDKAHDVPLSESLAPLLAEHIRQSRPLRSRCHGSRTESRSRSTWYSPSGAPH